MNKKGITALVTIPIAIVILVLALAFAGPIKEAVDGARSQNNTYIASGNATVPDTGLNCNNTTLSDFDDATCLFVDLFTPLYIALMIGLAFLIVGAKIVFSN